MNLTIIRSDATLLSMTTGCRVLVVRVACAVALALAIGGCQQSTPVAQVDRPDRLADDDLVGYWRVQYVNDDGNQVRVEYDLYEDDRRFRRETTVTRGSGQSSMLRGVAEATEPVVLSSTVVLGTWSVAPGGGDADGGVTIRVAVTRCDGDDCGTKVDVGDTLDVKVAVAVDGAVALQTPSGTTAAREQTTPRPINAPDDPPPVATTPPVAKDPMPILNGRAGERIEISPADAFDDVGTNSAITSMTVDESDRGFLADIGADPDSGLGYVKTRTSAALNALSFPPPNPFAVTILVKMANDKGHTAENRILLDTRYDKDSQTIESKYELTACVSDTQLPAGQGPQQKNLNSGQWKIPPGAQTRVTPDQVWTDTGTNPRITCLSILSLEHRLLDLSKTGISGGIFYVKIKTAAELAALGETSGSTTLSVVLRMINDEGEEASNAVVFEVTEDAAGT